MLSTAIPGRADALVDLVVLDIAGTTVQEHGAVYVALEDSVRAAGGTPSREDVARWMGADKVEAITALLACGHPGPGTADEAVVAGVYDDFRARLDHAYQERPPVPMTGVPEAFALLRGRGVKISLTTGFTREITRPLLDRVGWGADVLDAVVTVDDVTLGRPAPFMIFRSMELTGVTDVSRVLVAGDTVRDLQAGVNAGASFVVGVLGGGTDLAGLGRARHTHLLSGVGDVPALVL
ncbi:MAG TPA: phosphonatase-like hydrolase [Kineosporiaceae bacterium]|jgi:phosphonatase-like hydrolase|nr:phosphonatase-like hydrolase [Kineosporiaceae bacterium]